MSPYGESKKVQDLQESPASEKAQFLPLKKSFPTQPVMLGSPPSATNPYMSHREESKRVQGIQESPAWEKAQFLPLKKSVIPTQLGILGSPPFLTRPCTFAS